MMVAGQLANIVSACGACQIPARALAKAPLPEDKRAAMAFAAVLTSK
jgi:hypothetical protein